MNPYALSGLLAGISSFLIGIFVLLRSPNKKVGRIWFLFALAVSVYELGVTQIATDYSAEYSLYAMRISYAFGVIWIPILFHHFVCKFLDIQQKKFIWLNYCVGASFIFLLPGRLLFAGAQRVFDSMYFPVGGSVFPYFFVWWMGLVVYSHFVLYRALKDVSVEKKNKIKYFFMATAIGFSGGSLAFLPNFKIPIYPYGNFTVILYPLIMAYAIVKHHLLELQVVIRKTLVYGTLLAFALVLYVVFVAHYTHRGILPLANFSILTFVLSLAMALFAAVKGYRRELTQLWSITCLSIALWSLGFGMMTRAQTFEQCIYWQKWFLYGGAVMIPVVYLHFVAKLVNESIGAILKCGYAAAGIFQIINALGFLATAKIKPPFLYYTEAIFPFYHLYALYFFAFAVYAHLLLLKHIRQSTGDFKNQLQYVFVGTSVGFFGGCLTFPLSFNIYVFPIGTYLVVFYLIPITYAIYKHNLMDIHVAFRKSVVYSLMTAILTGIYLVLLTQGAHFLQQYFGASTIVTSTIAAFIIAAIFMPIRNRVQAIVDRYFFQGWQDREAVREVAAGFSHELKSPLAGLAVRAEMTLNELEELERGDKSLKLALPAIKEKVRYILSQTLDAARRVDAVHGMAEPSAAQVEPVLVLTALDKSLEMLSDRLRNAGISIQKEIDDKLPMARSNAKQLEIVLSNLIKNAIESVEGTNKGACIEICTYSKNRSVVFSIKDNGPGISSKDLAHIFKPYFTTKGINGSGMGLYLASQIIKAHGGSIEVRSEEGKGTEFIVRLQKYEQKRSGGEAA